MDDNESCSLFRGSGFNTTRERFCLNIRILSATVGSADDVAMTQKKFPLSSMVRTIGRHNNSQCLDSAKKFPLAAIFVT